MPKMKQKSLRVITVQCTLSVQEAFEKNPRLLYGNIEKTKKYLVFWGHQ